MTCTEYIRNKWGDKTQADLAREIAKMVDVQNGNPIGTEDFEPYRKRINKWWSNPEMFPDSAILLPLSKVLGVSVESILRGEDVPDEYGNRPTAYAAAKSCDKYIIDGLFRHEEVCLHDTDEYAKSFIDYVIEFNNYRAFQIAINKGYNYPTKWGTYLELNPRESKVDFELTKMIVEADDLEMFKKAYGRLYQDKQSAHAVYMVNDIPSEITELILKTQKILNWLMQIQAFTDDEWKELNHRSMKVKFHNPNDNYVWEIPSMVYGYSHLLNCAIAKKSDSLNVLLDGALEYVKKIKQFLGNRIVDFGIVRYECDTTEFAVCFKNDRRSIYAFVPYIENAANILNHELRKKAEEINVAFQVLEY